MTQLELSPRELQVLEQMASGKSNKEIGQVPFISLVSTQLKTM
jgi:DNA-binding CsgD family transcriptional regulator